MPITGVCVFATRRSAFGASPSRGNPSSCFSHPIARRCIRACERMSPMEALGHEFRYQLRCSYDLAGVQMAALIILMT